MGNKQVIAASARQKDWNLPAVVNFIFAGTGSGCYVFFHTVQYFTHSPALDDITVRLFKNFAMPALVCLGFLALTLEAGKPARGLFLLRGIRHSWMSRETGAFAVFVITAVMSGFIPGHFLESIAMVAGLALLVSQGFILSSSRGIPAWNWAFMPLFFLSSGIVAGAGLTMIFWPMTSMSPPPNAFLAAIICVLANALLWFLYVHTSKIPEPGKVSHSLGRLPSLLFIIGIGHFLPALLLAFVLTNAENKIMLSGKESYVMVSGLLVLISTAWQKVSIILFRGYHQEIEIRN